MHNTSCRAWPDSAAFFDIGGGGGGGCCADQKADKTCWSASLSCSCAKGWDDKGQRMSWKTAECPTQQSKIWQPSRSLTHSDHSFFFLNFGGGAGGVPIGRSGTGEGGAGGALLRHAHSLLAAAASSAWSFGCCTSCTGITIDM